MQSGSAISVATAPPARVKKGWAILDSRYTAPAFITLILVVGHLSYGILESYLRTALAIATAIAAELVLGRLVYGKWLHPASAYITGISVGILVRSPAYWPYVVCSLLSIGSKYVLRVRGKHIWNPSNFGISVMVFLVPAAVATLSIQWGNALWPMLVIWVLGSVIVWRVKRFHICATYVLSFLAFAFLRSWLTGNPWQAEVSPLTGPMYQLFVFFMITDPKTTVASKRGQMIVVFLVAFVEFLLRLGQSVYAPFYALCIVGPIANVVDMWWNARLPKAARAAA